MSIVGLNGQVLTPEQESIGNIKESILTIEGLFFAIRNANIPFQFAEAALKGMGMLQKMHDQLLAQLSPEEIEKMKQKYNTQKPGAA